MERGVIAFILVFILTFPLTVKGGETFYIDSSYDINRREQVSALLKLTSSRAYFYVEEEYLNGKAQDELDLFDQALQNLSQEFDNTIYPKMTAVYGSAGVDRVTVLATPMKAGYRGYFMEFGRFDLPREVEPPKSMIYINAADIISDLAPAYLAHEFQHLINYNQRCRGIACSALEERWLNEALSEYAPTLCGYNDVYEGSYLSGRVRDFIQSPYDPLGEWKEKPADYGAVSLFMHYLVGRFGEELISKIMTNGLTGIASVEKAVTDVRSLTSAGSQTSETDFEEIFADWSVANYLNDADINLGGSTSRWRSNLPNTYSYNPNCCGRITYDKFHLSSQVTYGIYPASETGSSFMIKDWAGSWYKFIPSGSLGPGRGDSLSIEFTGGTFASDFKASVIISDFEGNNEVRSFYISDRRTDAEHSAELTQRGKFYVPDFGWKIAQVVFIPFNGAKLNDFGAFDPYAGFSFTARSEILNHQIDGNLWPEGSLIGAQNTDEVYIVKSGFKRWIQTPELFNMYGHFKWEDIIGAPEANISSYQDAWLIRKAGDFRVFEVNGDGTKHWLNMTAEEFEKSGREWGMIYEVNDEEFNWYKRGSDVLYQ